MTLLYYSLLITLPCRNPKKIIYSFRFDTWKPIKGTLFFEVDTNITVTGVGLVISPGADVTVTLQAKGPTYLWGIHCQRPQNVSKTQEIMMLFLFIWKIQSTRGTV